MKLIGVGAEFLLESLRFLPWLLEAGLRSGSCPVMKWFPRHFNLPLHGGSLDAVTGSTGSVSQVESQIAVRLHKFLRAHWFRPCAALTNGLCTACLYERPCKVWLPPVFIFTECSTELISFFPFLLPSVALYFLARVSATVLKHYLGVGFTAANMFLKWRPASALWQKAFFGVFSINIRCPGCNLFFPPSVESVCCFSDNWFSAFT